MKRLALLLALLLCLTLFSGCLSTIVTNTAPEPIEVVGVTVMEDAESAPEQDTAPVVTETPDPDTTAEPSSEPEPVPEAEPIPEHNEGDISSDTQAQISALEQSSTVRDDDVAPVEASAYCKLTVSCEVLLEHREVLTDVLLPPDGMFYSGTVVLTDEETALHLIADKLAACGLICEMMDNELTQVAAIPNDLIENMAWVVFCNDQPLDDPAAYAIQPGDVLVLSYVPHN